MRILIIHQNFVDHQHPGGTRHLDLATRLVRKGHEVTIVASRVDYLTGRRIADRGVEDYDGVKVVRAYALPCVQRGLFWRTLSYLSFLPFSFWTALRVGPVDVVLGTTPPIFQLPSTWLVAVLRRAPFVLEVLDLWPEFAIGMGVLKNRLLIWLARRVEWFFYRVARQLVVNSPAYRDYLTRGGIDPQIVTFIPMGVDPDLFTPDLQGQDLRSQLGLEQSFVVTYAGALGMANDLDTVVRAAETLQHDPDICFLLAGGGKERGHLEQEVAQRGLSNVRFVGFFPKERVRDLLAASDACLATLRNIPEFRTPFPNKVFDYMAAGRPIILGIDGVIREVVETAGCGICIPPGDEQALADAVRRLKADPGTADTMAQAGREYVIRHYHIQLQADRFETVFQRALEPS